jgi:hypothetical protein
MKLTDFIELSPAEVQRTGISKAECLQCGVRRAQNCTSAKNDRHIPGTFASHDASNPQGRTLDQATG